MPGYSIQPAVYLACSFPLASSKLHILLYTVILTFQLNFLLILSIDNVNRRIDCPIKSPSIVMFIAIKLSDVYSAFRMHFVLYFYVLCIYIVKYILIYKVIKYVVHFVLFIFLSNQIIVEKKHKRTTTN